MRPRYERTPVEVLEMLPDAELLEGFETVCTTICNAHNFTKSGPTRAMRDDCEAFAREIMRRMEKPPRTRRRKKIGIRTSGQPIA